MSDMSVCMHCGEKYDVTKDDAYNHHASCLDTRDNAIEIAPCIAAKNAEIERLCGLLDQAAYLCHCPNCGDDLTEYLGQRDACPDCGYDLTWKAADDV